jgi:hypothetical protein
MKTLKEVAVGETAKVKKIGGAAASWTWASQRESMSLSVR